MEGEFEHCLNIFTVGLFFLSRLRFDILSFLIQFPTLSSILDLSSLWLFLSFNYQ